jgi:signal transduction histidine kinase/DNA-binding response OmpR family regulator
MKTLDHTPFHEITTMKAKVRMGHRNTPSVNANMPISDVMDVFSLPLSVLLQNSNAGIFVTDPKHKFIWANEVIVNSFDMGPDACKVVNQPFATVIEFFRPFVREPDAFEEKMKELRRRKKTFFGWPILFIDGHIREVSYMPLLDKGRFRGAIWQVVDATKNRVPQQELERARQEAEEAQRAQKDFLANMSHEIRTPLNAIIGMAHLLEETNLDERQDEYVKTLKHTSGILLGLITDILDLSRIEAGELQVNQREFNLGELIQSLKHTFELKMGQRPVKISASVDPRLEHFLVGDDLLLNQILMNLLGNADKFTKEGEIALSAELESWQENTLWVRFRVCDTGIGIRKDKLELVFQNYKQAEKEIREIYGGTGLGLAIVKQLVERQGGHILVEEQPGYRTCFSFNLPFIDTNKPVVSGSVLGKRRRQIDFGGARVLIIEDNPMNLRYIISLLEKFNIHCQLATNAPDALYFLDSRLFELILMDIRIPGMDGFELTKRIRADEKLPNVATPIVATTAVAMESTATMARNIGITDILTKPYTPDQLLQILNKYLNEDETALLMEEEEDINGYEFHEELNTKYLRALYENNIAYAADLFEIFIKTIRGEVRKLENFVHKKDLENLKIQVHKLKPNFAMVGLTWVSDKMQEMEDVLKDEQEATAPRIESLYAEIAADMNRYFPVVEEEFSRMLHFMKEQGVKR